MNISGEFGSMVFNDNAMRARLPKETYKALKKTIEEDRELGRGVADVVANAMKDWAIERGVTHFTHWFQPMTGITAEKHDSFISPTEDGNTIMEFSGKELIKGEPDASSFPSGGLRATFEARGYTAWDPTSFAFIKDGVLCIPTAFCSYGGEALDKKTPLLKSMEALNRHALRILRLFGNESAKRVSPTVGAEQEYFLIDRKVYEQRRDLIYCNRTLFGARPPKGQEMDDHYFGAIRPRVSAYMKELDEELWKLGILSKTEHNEAAPGQHELAPVYSTANIASDHNQITMEMMKRIASKHGMACLLHEKPFAGINGSGKHNNWSLSTDTGENLLEPTSDPSGNLQFLLFLTAIIKGVDEYQDLLRLSAASAGNDHRLGASEAPPAIVSMYLGDEITAVLAAIEAGCEYNCEDKHHMMTDVVAIPSFKRDNSDRNRTSPFAFTGNKFEFRMLGSSLSLSGPTFTLNTIVADELAGFADILEKAGDFEKGVYELIRGTLKKHKRIIFNGNNYSPEWVEEAKKRGLSNLESTADAMPYFVHQKNIDLFVRQGVLSAAEIRSRYEINMENYCKVIDMEAVTMLQMSRKSIIPAVSAYTGELASTAAVKRKLPGEIDCTAELKIVKTLSRLLGSFLYEAEALEETLGRAQDISGVTERARAYRDEVFESMRRLRIISDSMEAMTSKLRWPWPTYGDILFSV